jgi:hypothetical protein
MSWVIAKCIFKSGNNNLRDYIGKYNKFSSKKSHIRKALAHEALQSRKHNQNITELIKKMDNYVSHKMVWREEIKLIQYQQLQLLNINPTMDNLLCRMSRVNKWKSTTSYHTILGKSIAVRIIKDMQPEQDLSYLKTFASRHIVQSFIDNNQRLRAIDKILKDQSSVSLVQYVRMNSFKLYK